MFGYFEEGVYDRATAQTAQFQAMKIVLGNVSRQVGRLAQKEMRSL